MFCEKCGIRIEDDYVFCPICGAQLAEALEAQQPQQAYQQTYQQQPQAYSQAPASAQPQQVYQQTYQQPQAYSQASASGQYQQAYQQPAYGQQVYVQQTAAPQPVKKKNGQAITGLIFGILALILILISMFIFRQVAASTGALNNSAIFGAAAGSVGIFIIGLIMLLLNLIFSIIGFVKGLKYGTKRVVAIIGFALLIINIIIIVFGVYSLGGTIFMID